MRLITRLCGIAVLAALAAPPVPAQHGGATVKVTGRVSPVVAVSAAPPARTEGAEVQVSASNAGAHALTLSLSGQGRGATRIDVPLRLRSNTGFTLAASGVTTGATLSALSVVEVGGGGRFVHPGAAERVEVAPAFDGRPGGPGQPPGGEDFSSPVTILGGPPVSTGGTLDSPDNHVEVVLRVVINAPDAGKRWHAELQLSAATRHGR
jgi:hypothetical protein